MTVIYFAESNVKHEQGFKVDVPVGYHWLLVLTKTPAEFWVNGEVREYAAHSAVLFRPGQKVYYRASQVTFINDWIRFETSEPYITDCSLDFGQPIALSQPDYCYKLMELLAIEHRQSHYNKRVSIDSLLKILMNKLSEASAVTVSAPYYKQLLNLRNAIYVSAHEKWTVSTMASQLMVSTGYLQSIYKKTFGVSCFDDVIASRMRLATEYLQCSNFTVTEIAMKCGYRNIEHFYRQFKKHVGLTPRQYQLSITGRTFDS